MRAPLISPDRVSIPRISRKDGRRPLVVPRPLVRIPRRSAGGAVVHEIEHRVVGDPTPDCSAADLPTVWRPARNPEILTAVGCVKGMKPGSEQYVAVGASAPSDPCNLAIGQLERRKLSAHAELSAAVADQDFAIHDERRHRDRLPMADVAGPRLPDLLTVDRVQRDGLVIERIEDDLPVGIDGATIDNVATSDALSGRIRIGLIGPFQRRGGLLEAESVEVIRIGRHDVHRAANDDRSRLVSLGQTGRKREGKAEIGGVAHVDLVE